MAEKRDTLEGISTNVHQSCIMFIKVTISHLMNPANNQKVSAQVYQLCEAALYHLERNEGTLDYYSAVFKPFQAALNLKQLTSTLLALDCLAKLFDYNFWQQPARTSIDGDSLIDMIVEAITNTFIGEQTDDKIQMQIIKSMTAAISINDFDAALHGGLLLKAVRVIYNIFLISKSSQVQTVAQATLQQITGTIFNRIPRKYTFNDIMEGHESKFIEPTITKSQTDIFIKGRGSKFLADRNQYKKLI
jgi:brefeldin A-inhibited guanine nucleotide-exchange protein